MDIFNLNKQYLSKYDLNQLEEANKPICHIYKKVGKYYYFEVDFITCNYCLSSLGQSELQRTLNLELIFMWLRGYKLKVNYSNVGQMTILLRGDKLAIIHLLNQLSLMSKHKPYWFIYRNDNRILSVKRDETLYTQPIREKNKKLVV